MEPQRVDMFIISNSKYFESYKLPEIREHLLGVNDAKWVMIQTLQLKDPTIALVVSLIVGHLGIDRFFIGDVGLGLGKLLTCGGLGIWTIVDWFLIMNATRRKNFEKFSTNLV